jgi:tetratricopeptide (TPR) repeat protein
VHFARGVAFAAIGAGELATISYDAVIELDPNNAGAYAARAAIRFESKRPHAALADADRALALDPNMAAAYALRAAIREVLNQKDAAATDRVKAQELSHAATVHGADQGFCAFIARKAVRGELTPGGGAKIPDYCRSAMDDAKSCAEQKCSIADIIDREERDNSRPLFHWGADDYQAIEALQK